MSGDKLSGIGGLSSWERKRALAQKVCKTVKVLEVIDNDELKFEVKGCVKELQMAS
jgi:hypothetical protein